MKRIGFLGLAAVVVTSPVPVMASPPESGQLTTYDLGLVCHTANKFAGDDTKARQSFQVAFAVGHAMGKSDTEIVHDLDHSLAIDGNSFKRDRSDFETAKKNCANVGL
jgi:hypothetical protein